jgi:hypothetical protein
MEPPSTSCEDAWRAAQQTLQRLCPSLDSAQRAHLAREHKAFVRARKVPDADTLLHLILFYTHASRSLRMTTWFALVAFRITLCEQSLRERLAQCAGWLRALVLKQLAAFASLPSPLRTRLRIVDGSVLCRPGAKGTEWRVHVVFEPGQLAPTSVEVTDAHGAEGLDQGEIASDSVVLGDRNYGRYREVRTARERGLHLLARTHLQTQPMHDAQGRARTAQHWTNLADAGQFDHAVQLHQRGEPALSARLLMRPLPPEMAERARQKVRQKAKKKGRVPDALALHLAGYLCLLTTLSVEELSVDEACALYRIRWQVECFFKRAKSLGKLGKIEGKAALVETQIWAHLLVLCAQETQRPVEALEKIETSTWTHRPASPWRWLQVQLLVLVGPLVWLAHLGANEVSVRAQDERLRERGRRRGRHPLWEMSGWWQRAQGLGNGLPEALSWRLWGPGVRRTASWARR